MGLPAFLHRTGQSVTLVLRNPKARRVGALIAFFLYLTFLVTVNFFGGQPLLTEGEVAPRDILSPFTKTITDPIKTREAQEQARQRVPKQYDFDPQVKIAVQNDITAVVTRVAAVQSDDKLDLDGKVEGVREAVPFTLPADVLTALAQGDPKALTAMAKDVNDAVAHVMERSEGVTQDNLPDTKKELATRFNELGMPRSHEILARGLTNHFLRPNAFFNAARTREMQEAAARQVRPVLITIKKDEKIIGKGEIVTAEHAVKLEKLGLMKQSSPVKSIIGAGLLVALTTGLILLYLRRQHREIFKQVNHLYLIGIVVATVATIAKVLVAIKVSQWPEFGDLMGYTVPTAAAGMLIAILLDSRLAIVVVAALSGLVGAMTGAELKFALVGLLSGIAGVYSVSKLSQRTDLARAGIYVGAVTVAAICATELLGDQPLILLVISSLVLGTANGLLSSVLANGALPFLESTFGITSSVKLIELANPGQPLLKRLLVEAPGTYHHSIIVGNLAEAAADAVNGDAVLVRVGAYYHDVGKVRRPAFFIENQVGAENPHDKIAPSLSTLILTSHVKDGVEYAREQRLPQRIVDIIEQHHGTSLCSYFYHKALEQDDKDVVKEDDFRYEGPKPQSKEAAIVMLADSVEAAVRSLERPSPGQLEGLVRKLIKEKLADGQLDECDLNFRDLDLIAGAFLRVLTGIFHTRIEYPDPKEMERRRARSGRRHQ
ncbi:MAG: HDIG domain-containing protein [Bacillota bacterium]|nr:HDIG domain-containing protein [Bacillota bacterium]